LLPLAFGRVVLFFTRATFAAGLAAPRAAGFAAGLAAGFAAPFGAGRPPRERPLPLAGASLPLNAADSLADRPVACSWDCKSAATSGETSLIPSSASLKLALERIVSSLCERATSSAMRDGPEPSCWRAARTGPRPVALRRSVARYSGTPPGAPSSASSSVMVSMPSSESPPTPPRPRRPRPPRRRRRRGPSSPNAAAPSWL